MSHYIWLLDAGHGGVDKNGNYTTPLSKGKRFDYEDGFTILEGVTNRAIVSKVANILDTNEIDYKLIHDDVEDATLSERMRRVRNIVAKSIKPCMFLSIHSNAGGGNGLEFYTSPGQDSSDVVCEYFCIEAQRTWPNVKWRSDKTDGDHDKEASFYVLLPTDKYGVTINTAPVRILFEFFFFDNRIEAEYLASEKGQTEIAEFLTRVIFYTENHFKYATL